MGRLRNRLLPLLLLLSLTCFKAGWRCQAQRLAAEEVDVLKLINAKMRVGWDTSVEPCSMSQGWVDPTFDDNVARNVTCDCDLTNLCHVTSISLKSQNLTGVLPAEFANLTSLKNLDLSRNYLNGSIPSAWARLPIVSLSLLGNRISGRIPEELGNMTMLQSLYCFFLFKLIYVFIYRNRCLLRKIGQRKRKTHQEDLLFTCSFQFLWNIIFLIFFCYKRVLENNQLEGPIPASIGKLKNLSRLLLSANNFSGELPDSLGNLENMSDFRIDGNPFSGKIPNFIANWVRLNRLDIQGTNLEGPFPPSFANLNNIIELKVTGLKGMNGEFPHIQNMKNMKRLVLRNMSINGQLPPFIGDMSQLKILDLSFNNLSGQIPDQYSALDNSIDYMFLTSNMLSGTIPLWIRSSNKNLDLSFNNFSGSNTPSDCQIGNVNLVGRSTKNNSIEACLSEDNSCLGENKNYNFSINCGGKMVTIGDLIYEEDSTVQGSSYFTISKSRKWAYSSTGVFLGNENLKFTTVNATKLNMTDVGLYTTARLSPLSLKYYGLCLQKGNYTISLHFAEIMLIDDETYFSVGKRIFDVSIQGEKVLEDFDIVRKANGTGKKIVKNFTTIVDGTLEIHFQWMGKGTNAIPYRGVYGPLISAISVTPNFTPKVDFNVHKGGNKLSVGAIIGIVIAVCFIVFLLLAFWCYFRRKPRDYELGGLQLQTGMFTLRQIKAATKNFSPENKIGEGGFGSVYKGELSDGSLIAVKQLSSKSKQGNREFVNEIGMIAALNHPNLVRLFGCCIEGNQLLVIYEYMENNCLARALFGPGVNRLSLDWPTRKRICLDIARGLAYLHEESRLRIVHRDIKATNILLDKDLSAKISDFGLAKLNEEDNTHISTRIAGTVGYMAPEYAMRGYLTDKADVYSFGIVMLEIVSGKSNTNYKPKEEFVYLLDWAYVLHERGNLLELVDPNLGVNYSQEEAMKMLELTLACTNPSPTLRPAMSTVMSILDGTAEVQMQPFTSFASSREDIRFRSFERWSKESQTPSTSTDGPWSISSGSLSGTKAKS